MAVTVFSGLGYEPLAANSGMEALHMLSEIRISKCSSATSSCRAWTALFC